MRIVFKTISINIFEQRLTTFIIFPQNTDFATNWMWVSLYLDVSYLNCVEKVILKKEGEREREGNKEGEREKEEKK